MSYYYTPWHNEIGPQEIFLVGLGPSGIIRGDFLLSWEADGIDRLWLLTIILNKIWVPIPGRYTTMRGENRTPTNLLVKAVSFRDHTSLLCSTLLKHLLSVRAFHLRQGSEGLPPLKELLAAPTELSYGLSIKFLCAHPASQWPMSEGFSGLSGSQFFICKIQRLHTMIYKVLPSSKPLRRKDSHSKHY